MNEPTLPSVISNPVARPSDEPILLPPPIVRCDYCQRQLEDGDAYYQLHVGMDNAPNFVGDSPGEGSLVEESSESTVCHACEPAVSEAMDVLLTTLWKLRKPDGTEGNPEAFAAGSADAEPDTERLPKCQETSAKT